MARGDPVASVIERIEQELVALLSLRGCRLERPPFTGHLPRLERGGAVDTPARRFVRGEFALPEEGVEITVLARGREVARLVLEPDPGVGVSLDERVVAVALADQLGAALASDRPEVPDAPNPGDPLAC
jgi:hypothetical protein